METNETRTETELYVQPEENSLKIKETTFNYEDNFGQNLTGAIIWGAISAIVGAIIWAGITALIKVQIGWMAVGVGFLVGFAVKTFGRGVEPIFGFVGAGFALLGCILGNLFTIIIMSSIEYDISIIEILLGLDLSLIGEIMQETFHPMDLLFYGIAVYEGFKFSFTPINKKEIEE